MKVRSFVIFHINNIHQYFYSILKQLFEVDIS